MSRNERAAILILAAVIFAGGLFFQPSMTTRWEWEMLEGVRGIVVDEDRDRILGREGVRSVFQCRVQPFENSAARRVYCGWGIDGFVRYHFDPHSETATSIGWRRASHVPTEISRDLTPEVFYSANGLDHWRPDWSPPTHNCDPEENR